MSKLVQAAITDITGRSLSTTDPESSQLGGLEPRVKVPADPVSGEATSWVTDTSPHWGREGRCLGSENTVSENTDPWGLHPHDLITP